MRDLATIHKYLNERACLLESAAETMERGNRRDFEKPKINAYANRQAARELRKVLQMIEEFPDNIAYDEWKGQLIDRDPIRILLDDREMDARDLADELTGWEGSHIHVIVTEDRPEFLVGGKK